MLPSACAVKRLLLVLPILLFSLVPQGFMPLVQADGGLTVTICTSAGPRTITLDSERREIPASPQQPADAIDLCVFAGFGTVALLPQPLDLKGPRFLPAGNDAHSGQVDYFRSPTGALGQRAPPITS